MQTYQLTEARTSESNVSRWPTRNAASGGHYYPQLRVDASPSQYTGLPKPKAEAAASHRYEVKERAPDRFAEYEAYDVNDWDGYGAEPIAAATVAWSRSFFDMLPRGHPIPDIAPGADGTVGFEWTVDRDGERQLIFVDVGPGERFRARQIRADGSLLEAWPVVGVGGLFDLVMRLSPLLR